MVSVLVSRSVQPWKKAVRWRIDPLRHEWKFLKTLLARLDEGICSFMDFHVFPNMDRRRRFDTCLSDP
jgi:hypothetical protein